MRKLLRLARSLVFRKRMAENLEKLEDEIRSFLLNQGKKEMVSNGFKISLKEGSHIEITKLPSSKLKQLKLPIKQEEKFEKGEKQ